MVFSLTDQTRQLAHLQVGDQSEEVKLVVSTIPEIENLEPLLQDYRKAGRRVNVLYGIPLPPSQTARLAGFAKKLGHGSISILVDHPDQLNQVESFYQAAQFPVQVYVKVDTGYHRAGLPPSTLNKAGLLDRIAQLEEAGQATFVGLYSHSSLSYKGQTPKQAMDSLAGEIQGCMQALRAHAHAFPKGKEITISVGASPQIVSIQNFGGRLGDDPDAQDSAHLRDTIREAIASTAGGFKTKVELHAGVYAVLDLQQLATNARKDFGDLEEEIAVSVVAEVCSVYNDGERQRPEALVAVGALGLGREPCPSYEGWGVVARPTGSKADPRRLIIERISQEHAIVAWELAPEEKGKDLTLPAIPLAVGESVRIYPNHACVTGAMYGWYLVVDSSEDQTASKVVDVWVRASGW